MRAIAVIPVILFHAGFTAFGGGFVGVDIFFVISGYLITSIIIADIERKEFSVARFYERRAGRILPALFTVMLCCLPFAWLWMSPTQLKNFGQAIVSVVLFVSNIQFWREENYFAGSAELNPLLHTWSLSVEEQYYLFFPLAMLLFWRFGPRKVLWGVIGVLLLSLALTEWGWRHAPSANFYLAPYRIWELLIGSVCAFVTFFQGEKRSEALSLIGLALIVGSVFLIDETTPFPSLYALAPVVGTALVVLFGTSGTTTGKLLAMRPFVGVGLISYSAYLWHQPLFAFARMRSIVEPSPWLMLALGAAALGLAYLSWRYVEQPFRKGSASILPPRRQVFAWSAAVSVVFVAIGVAGHLAKGFPARSSEYANFADLDNRIAPNYGLNIDCVEDFTASAKCQTAARPEVLLWGDSYAMHLAPGLMASDPGLALRQHTKSSCAPILGMTVTGPRFSEAWSRACMAFNDQAIAWLAQNPSVKYVVLSSAFGLLDEGIFLRDGTIVSKRDHRRMVSDGIMATVDRIRATGRKVIFISPTPENGEDIGQCLMRSTFLGAGEAACDFAYPDKLKNRAEFDVMMNISPKVPVILLNRMICAGGVCDTLQDGKFIYRDDGHLSHEGSIYLAQKYRLADLIRQRAR